MTRSMASFHDIRDQSLAVSAGSDVVSSLTAVYMTSSVSRELCSATG